MDKTPYTLNIQNVVASVDYGRKFDLTKIVSIYRDTEYRPEQFPGLVYRLNKPKTVVLIFTSGRMVITGAKSVEEVKEAVKKVTKDVVKKCFDMRLKEPYLKISNIVASGDFHGYALIDEIDRLHAEYPERYRAIYEPDQFPAAIIRDIKKYELEEECSFLLFPSGKYVCTGCKSKESLEFRIKDMYEALFETGLLVK